ncbi:MAG: hypothetical protein K2M63_00825 [Muribaculaceae bacterium]|nr:hypothetical protein [Muribaculaceae bacterium]
MDDKLFIIAIGGTGMRCLESFVHLCAAGMFDNKTIDILTLDTDQANGNKSRVENLIHQYNKVKTEGAQDPGGSPRTNTFFSAKLNLYRFATDYSSAHRLNYRVLTEVNSADAQARQDNRDLSDLFFDSQTVQDFDLSHGYRAQTHLGSLLMYHSIMEAAIKVKKGTEDVDRERPLTDFIQLINQNSGGARVFVFGSVFGGTGASSIPVIPLALKDALKVLTTGNNDLNLNNVKFGSTLLTDYFTFDMPDEQQLKKAKVIADSNNFALNSQAAMTFYDHDITVQNNYKMLYHIGWSMENADYSQDVSGEVVTGGEKQENACHLVELMSASAAYDFFTREDLSNTKAKYVFRSVEESAPGTLRLTGASFMGKDGPIFEERLGSLLSLSHIILSKYEGSRENSNGVENFLNDLKVRNVEDYEDITDEEARDISIYLQEFAYKFKNGKFIPGWLHQINKSINGSFIFSPEALSDNSQIISKVDPGAIYNDPRYHWRSSRFAIKKADSRFDKFIEMIKGKDALPNEEQGTTQKEKFLGHLFNAIIKSQQTSHLTQG